MKGYDNLKIAGIVAREHLLDSGYKHVVYACTEKSHLILTHNALCFFTDSDFLKFMADNTNKYDTIFAVHGLNNL